MESKDWAFTRVVDRDFLDTYHDPFVEYVSTSLRQQMADHIFGAQTWAQLLKQGGDE